MSIRRSVPPGSEEQVAALYWEAFAAKLGPGLAPAEQARAFLARTLVADRFLCAVAGGTVVGALGFHLAGRAALDAKLGDLARFYSKWSAPWRALALLPLHRSPGAGELLLDGLAVRSDARGHGIGTRLLAEAESLAADHRLATIRLSVVDTNPRAQRLYERAGYVATENHRLPILGAFYGFSSATEMVRQVAAATDSVEKAATP